MRREVFAVAVVCTALFTALVWPLRGAFVDDTYIHMQYARNLAEAGELSFNRGDPTYGATSPLWVALLALVERLGGDTILWCRILSQFFCIAAAMVVYGAAWRVTGSGLAAAAAAVLLVSEAWMVRWSAVGMETSFAVFMVALAMRASIDAPRGTARSALFGLLLFLAFLSRPEALLLAPLALVVAAAARGVPVGARTAWLAVFAPLTVCWLLVIEHHTGTFLPLTAGAKQGGPFLSIQLLGRALVPVQVFGATELVPWLLVLLGLAVGIARHRSLHAPFTGAGGRAGSAAAPPVGMRPDSDSAGVLLMLLWIFALPAVYVLFDFQVLSRYLLPVTPAVIVLGVASAHRAPFVPRISRRRAGILLVAVCLGSLLQNVLFYRIVVLGPTREFSEDLQGVVVPMGEWLRENTPEDAVVASPDIGAIGWFSERTVLDLGGLVTPEINRMRKETDVEVIIEEGRYLRFRPDYLLDRSVVPARFAGRVIGGVRFEEIMRGTVANLGIRKAEPVVYVLYRLVREPAGGGDAP